MLRELLRRLPPLMQRRGPILAGPQTTPGLAENSRHRVGVTRQSCGQLSKQDNRQPAMPLCQSSREPRAPIGLRLCLPGKRMRNRQRRRRAEAAGCARAGARARKRAFPAMRRRGWSFPRGIRAAGESFSLAQRASG